MPNRRITIIPAERRLEDITESEWQDLLQPEEEVTDVDTQIKLAQMDAKLAAQERRIMTIEDYHMTIGGKLDAKIEADRERQMDMEKTMTRAVTTLEHLTTVVDKLADSNATTVALVQKHEAIGTAIIKLGSIAAVIISGAWMLFTYIVDHWPG